MIKRASLSILTMGAALLLAVSLLRSLTPLSLGSPHPVLLTAAVENLICALGSLFALWYFLTAFAVLVSVALRLVGGAPVRLDRAIGSLGAPLLRRIATWTAVSSMVFGAPAMAGTTDEPRTGTSVATSSTDPRNATFLVDLGWVVTPIPVEQSRSADEVGHDPLPAGPPGSGAVSLSNPPDGAPDEAPEAYTIRPGDTLWGIAEAHLESGSGNVTAADIANHWPRWYLENRPKIGPDPDLITPGMTLHAPPSEES